MDRAIVQKSWLRQHLKWIIVGVVLAVILLYLLLILDFGKTLRVEASKLSIATVEEALFLEFLDVEGIVHPVNIVKINALEDGIVKEILFEEGVSVKAGDVFMRLDNPTLRRQIEEESAELEKQRINYRERIIEMEQSSINLRKQMLQVQFEAKNMKKKFNLDEQEYNMGVMSKARFEIAKDEYDYSLERNRLTMQELRNDSISREIRIELMKNDLQRQVRKFENSRERLSHLELNAPIDGQLSLSRRVEIGEQISRGQNIGEVKVITRFKLNSLIGEFYVDRITSGLNAYFMHQNRRYNLQVNRTGAEIKENKFEVDFLFVDEPPENLNLGKSFRLQIELSQPENKIVIPRGTFFQNTSGRWIFKIDQSGKYAYKQYINIGRQNPTHYEIMEGLKPGDRVIISGYDYFGDAEELVIN